MRKLLFIDSNKATKRNSHDDFLISVNSNFISLKEDEDLYVYPLEFSCRRDFYSVSNFNNAFSIYFNGQDHIYTLTTGFPTVLNLDEELQQDLVASLGGTFTIVYNQYKGRVEINGTLTNPPNDLALNFLVDNSAYEILGFTKKSHPFTISGNTVSLNGNALVNVRGETDLWVRTTLTNQNYENNIAGLTGSDALFKVPILVQPLNVIYYADNNKDFLTLVKNREINSISVKITDENGNLIGLNSNVQMVLAFEIIKRPKNKMEYYLEKIWEFQKLKTLKKELSL